MLNYLKSKKGALQQSLNQKAKELTEELNSFMLERNVPIKLMNFSSVIYYSYPKDLSYFSLLFYVLRHKGIHILEGFPMFLSEAHSDKDIKHIIDAFKDSVTELQDNGFFPAPLADNNKLESTKFVQQEYNNKFPLTDAQKEIWVASQMSDAASCAFNESARLEIKGKLNPTVLENAFNKVIQAHESLRTVFSRDGSYQTIQSGNNFRLKYTDLQSLPEDKKQKVLEEKLNKETTILFDFENGPLIRAELVTLNEEAHILIITSHHIICDGWSFDVMTKDLSKLYTDEIEGKNSELIPPMQMRDFVTYLNDTKKTKEYRNQENYWLNILKAPLTESLLPVNRNRPEIRTFNGFRISGKIESSLFSKVKELSFKTGNTIFVTLLSAFSVLLNKLTNEDDIITGIPTAGQQVVGVHDLVGHCTNLLPMRFDVNPNKKFVDYLREVKSLVLDAYDNQQVTYGDLISKLKLKRNASKTPLLSTMFNIDPAIFGLNFSNFECKMISNPRSGYQFELGYNLVILENECIIECDYNCDLFFRDTIKKFIEYYNYILEQVTQNSNITLGDIQILSPSEIENLINLLNQNGNGDSQ